MIRRLEDEVKVGLPEGTEFTQALLELLPDGPNRSIYLASCNSCAGCNNGGPTCVSCVCVSTGTVEYVKGEEDYGVNKNEYAFKDNI
ncbi:hypothetical protein J4230_02545 [Candidatus Woesearchaeota archaeon]|nr:hypothetical protein [Candidatus Woesearchaeota archaeon]